MKNLKKITETKIIDASESDFMILSANSSAAANSIHTPEAYIEFATQTNEIIGHRIREPRRITGKFLL